jgi:outer membrane biosynthesis protein TonB
MSTRDIPKGVTPLLERVLRGIHNGADPELLRGEAAAVYEAYINPPPPPAPEPKPPPNKAPGKKPNAKKPAPKKAPAKKPATKKVAAAKQTG